MTKPENQQPLLSCQELSKQCNDIDSCSSVALDHWPDRSVWGVCLNSNSPVHHRKGSIGIQSLTRDQVPPVDRCGMEQSLDNEQSSFGQIPDREGLTEGSDDGEEEGDCFDADASQDDDISQCESNHYMTQRWLPTCDGEFDAVDECQDFLDEIESALRFQVDSEIEVFRSTLHSIISQQQLHCRQYLSQEPEDRLSQPSPQSPQTSIDRELAVSPGQRVPVYEDAWSVDFMQSCQGQHKLDAMSTSTSSVQEEERGLHFLSATETDSSSDERQRDKLTVQLLTCALVISSAVQREEYTT